MKKFLERKLKDTDSYWKKVWSYKENRILLGAAIVLSPWLIPSWALADTAQTIWVEVVKWIQGGLLAGGILWTVFGGLQLALGLKDHNGPQTQNGIFQMIGGAIVAAMGEIAGRITINKAS
jgi:hypothetical protein